MTEYEVPICTFREQSYADGSQICETGICMKCSEGKWHANIAEPSRPTNTPG